MSRWAATRARLSKIPDPVKIIGALGALVALILGVIKLYQVIFPPEKAPRLSAVFILDVSPAMNEQLGTSTKLEAAENSIMDTVASLPGIATSLRLITTGCEATYSAATVPFHKSNGSRYADVFMNLNASSKSSYLSALNGAANDLTTENRINDSRQKLVVVFMANQNEFCKSVLPPVLASGGELSVNFLWLGSLNGTLSAVRSQLAELGFTEAKVRAIKSKPQLRKAIRQTMRLSPPPPPPPPAAPTGTSGPSGASGTSGTSGTSGASGTSGTSGASGASGTGGASGTTGPR
jgi:uncharacterized membrane protein YgcG